MSIESMSVDPMLDRLFSAFTATFLAFSGLFCFAALVLGLAGNLESGSVFAVASVGSVVIVVGVSVVRLFFFWPKLRADLVETAAGLPGRRARIQAAS